jgi:hypothetical protein
LRVLEKVVNHDRKAENNHEDIQGMPANADYADHHKHKDQYCCEGIGHETFVRSSPVDKVSRYYSYIVATKNKLFYF